jgi:hypothetical protein
MNFNFNIMNTTWLAVSALRRISNRTPAGITITLAN